MVDAEKGQALAPRPPDERDELFYHVLTNRVDPAPKPGSAQDRKTWVDRSQAMLLIRA